MDILNIKTFKKMIDNYTFTDYYLRLKKIALALFEYENLPENIKERHIEKFLYEDGKCMIYKNPNLDLMVCRCTTSGINDYGDPVDLHPVLQVLPDNNTYKNGIDAVLLRNDDLCSSMDFTLKLIAYRLAEITRSQDVNINAQKTPILILCNDKQKLTMKNIYAQFTGNEPVIYADKSMNMDNIKVLKTDAPIVFDKLELQKHHVWNECMTFLGVNNANLDKKERLVDDEVQANNGQIIINQKVLLKAREEGVAEINRIFGTNIKVKPRIDIESYSEGSEDDYEDEYDNGGTAA